MLLAMDLEQILERWGAAILGPVPTIDRALDLISEERPDAVTLDMNLSGISSLPLAEELAMRNIPFVVISGYSDSGAHHAAFRDAQFLRKPYSESALLTALTSVLR